MRQMTKKMLKGLNAEYKGTVSAYWTNSHRHLLRLFFLFFLPFASFKERKAVYE